MPRCAWQGSEHMSELQSTLGSPSKQISVFHISSDAVNIAQELKASFLEGCHVSIGRSNG
jgi:hypothetical protein